MKTRARNLSLLLGYVVHLCYFNCWIWQIWFQYIQYIWFQLVCRWWKWGLLNKLLPHLV